MTGFQDKLQAFKRLTESLSSKADKALETLKKDLRADYAPPQWLAGLGIAYDSHRSRTVIVVSVRSGYHASNLPRHINGVPVVVVKSNIPGNLPY
jgi:hypothetical protein